MRLEVGMVVQFRQHTYKVEYITDGEAWTTCLTKPEWNTSGRGNRHSGWFPVEISWGSVTEVTSEERVELDWRMT